MHRLPRVIFAVLLTHALPAAAQAPEVMLLIDNSRQMSEAIGPAPVACAARGTARPVAGAAYNPDSALNLLKEALVGTIRGPRWCVTEGAAHRAATHRLGADGAAPHHRAMCCAVAACDRFVPCGEDHDSAANQAGEARVDVAWDRDGLLTEYGAQVKFSMLSTDGAPSTDPGAAGHYSFGPNVGGANLGARRAGDHTGGYVPAHMGRDGALDQPVDESAAQIRSHADLLAGRVRALVPHGEAPLAALIEDARVAAAGEDPLRACRPRAAVLVTRGIDMDTPYGPPEDAAARFHAETGMPLFVVVLAAVDDGPPHRLGERIARKGAPDAAAGVFRVADGPALRRALDTIIRGRLIQRSSAGRPLVMTPAAVDVCPPEAPDCAPPADAVVQWRVTGFTARDRQEAVGRVHAEALSCQGEAAPRRSTLVRYEAVLADGADRPRRTLWQQPPVPLSGGAGACFDAVGRATCPLPPLDAALQIVGAPPPDRRPGLVADPGPRRRAGLLVNGHFGAAGLGDGGRRQLGALGDHHLVALRPPNLAIAGQAWQTYRARMDRRPTIVATGADDGALHLFRARDGVEVLSVAVQTALPQLQTGRGDARGALDVADMLACRTIGAGAAADCPSDADRWPLRALLAGTTPSSVYGLDLTHLDRLAQAPERPLDAAQGLGAHWTRTADGLRDPARPATNTLGVATSRPLLVHLRHGVNQTRRVRAAVVVGCGSALDGGGDGQCVVVLDALTGAVIRRFDARDDARLTAAMTGDPAAYPAGNVAAAERVYLGDAQGRMWRIDARAEDPKDWQIAIAWPPADAAEAAGYVEGRGVVGRPSLAIQANGRLAVLFATGEGAKDAGAAHWVSFTDAVALDAAGLGFEVTRNWIMPLAPTESATDGPVVRDGVAFLTTRTDGAGACGESRAEGRLYGVDFVKRYTAADGAPGTFTFGDRRLEVAPALPHFEEGARAERPALAVVLPPGRLASGLALARTPGCADQPATNSVILNLSAQDGGPNLEGDAAVRASGLEVVREDAVVRVGLADQMFARSQAGQLDLCLDCGLGGAAPAAALPAGLAPPFPSRLTYWGSTLLD